MLVLLRLAFRSLARHRRRTALTLSAIAFGAAMVVVMWGIGEGIAGWLVRTAVSGRMGSVQVHALGYVDTIDANPIATDFAEHDLDRVANVAGVLAVAPRIKFAGIVSTGASSSMVQVDGIDPVADAAVCPERYLGFAAGGPLTRDGVGREIVVGTELAASLGTKVGDTVTLMAGTRAGAQNALDFTVVGITSGGAFLESKRAALTRINDARALLAMPERAHELAIATAPDLDADVVATSIRAALTAAAPNRFEVHTWKEVSPFMRDAVDRITIILRGVSAVLFLVVVMGVANTMLMSIFERVREIGTLLALGMKRRAVLTLCVIEAIVMGGLGGVVGGGLGSAIVLALAINGIDFAPPGSSVDAVLYPVLTPTLVLGVGLAVFAGAVIASFLPARRASRLDPVEALRSL
jgi:putative ABC transport system permease protein